MFWTVLITYIVKHAQCLLDLYNFIYHWKNENRTFNIDFMSLKLFWHIESQVNIQSWLHVHDTVRIHLKIISTCISLRSLFETTNYVIWIFHFTSLYQWKMFNCLLSNLIRELKCMVFFMTKWQVYFCNVKRIFTHYLAKCHLYLEFCKTVHLFSLYN